MSNAGVAQASRQCLRTVIRSRLRVLVGDFGEQAELYRLVALRSLLHRGGDMVCRRTLLSMPPSVDWANHAEVEPYVAPGQERSIDRDEVAGDFLEALVGALHYRRLRIYPCRRRLGQVEAVCDMTPLQTAHGLFAFEMWAASATAVGRRIAGRQPDKPQFAAELGHDLNEASDLRLDLAAVLHVPGVERMNMCQRGDILDHTLGQSDDFCEGGGIVPRIEIKSMLSAAE